MKENKIFWTRPGPGKGLISNSVRPRPSAYLSLEDVGAVVGEYLERLGYVAPTASDLHRADLMHADLVVIESRLLRLSATNSTAQQPAKRGRRHEPTAGVRRGCTETIHTVVHGSLTAG